MHKADRSAWAVTRRLGYGGIETEGRREGEREREREEMNEWGDILKGLWMVFNARLRSLDLTTKRTGSN